MLAPAIKVGEKKLGYIDETGHYIIPPRYNFCYNFSECGLAGVYDNLSNKGLFINKFGDTIIKENAEYNFLKFEGDVTMAGFVDSALIVIKDEFCGAINTLGEIIIPIEYNSLSRFNEGRAVGIKNGVYYIVDKKNNTIQININNLNKLNPIHNGYASFKTNDNKFGFINSSGDIIIEPIYLSVGIFEEGLAWAELSSHKYGYIDYTGEWIIAPNLWKAHNFNKKSYYAPVITLNGEDYCFISKTGHKLKLSDDIRITPSYGFTDGLAIVEKDHKSGCINFFGQWKVMPIFKYIWKFSHGYAVAQKDSYLGIIDKNGNWAVQPEFTKIGKLVQLNDQAQ